MVANEVLSSGKGDGLADARSEALALIARSRAAHEGEVRGRRAPAWRRDAIELAHYVARLRMGERYGRGSPAYRSIEDVLRRSLRGVAAERLYERTLAALCDRAERVAQGAGA